MEIRVLGIGSDAICRYASRYCIWSFFLLTDWFFFGVPFHSRYQEYPEVWRKEFSGGNEWKAVLMATAISALMAGAFLFFLYRLGVHGYPQPLELAVAIWLIAALPATATNFIFIKLHPAILVSHSLGWLVAAGDLRGILHDDSRSMTLNADEITLPDARQLRPLSSRFVPKVAPSTTIRQRIRRLREGWLQHLARPGLVRLSENAKA